MVVYLNVEDRIVYKKQKEEVSLYIGDMIIHLMGELDKVCDSIYKIVNELEYELVIDSRGMDIVYKDRLQKMGIKIVDAKTRTLVI